MPSGTIQEQPTVFFAINVEGCKWLVRFVTDEGLNNPFASDYQEVSFDGENIYYLNNIKSAVEYKRKKGAKMAPNIAHGRVYKGQVFNGRVADEVGAIWLAYASMCYFQSRTNEFVEPAMAFDESSDHYGPPEHKELRARWTLSDSEPHFPLLVTYFASGYMKSPGGLVKRSPPYDGGFVDAEYEVQKFTDFAGFRAPSVASLKLFQPVPTGATSNDSRLFVEYCISVTNATEGAAVTAFQPQLPGATAVHDERDGGLFYYRTNDWPTLGDLQTNGSFVELKRRNTSNSFRAVQTVLPRSQWAARGILALVIFFPVLYFGWRRFWPGGRVPGRNV